MRSKMLSLNIFLFVEDLLFYSFLWANGISRLLAVQTHLVKYSVPRIGQKNAVHFYCLMPNLFLYNLLITINWDIYGITDNCENHQAREWQIRRKLRMRRPSIIYFGVKHFGKKNPLHWCPKIAVPINKITILSMAVPHYRGIRQKILHKVTNFDVMVAWRWQKS